MATIKPYAAVMVVLFAGCCFATEKSPFFDLSHISYNVVQLNEESIINFGIRPKGRLVEIHCLNCIEVKNEQAKCKNKQIVYLILQIEYLSKNYTASIIIDCQTQNRSLQYPSISHLKSQASTDQIKLSWDTNSKGTMQYIVDLMNNTHQSYQLISTDEKVFILDNLRERTLYQVCIAEVNNQWLMSSYKCIRERTDFSKSGPVTNHTIQVFENQILLSWSKPRYHLDDPQGYVINYINTSNKTCHTIIIDMKNHKIPKDLGCSRVTVKQWNKLQVLQIHGLAPDTEYNIEILPFNHNKEPDGVFLTSKTRKIDTLQMKFEALETFNYTISKSINKGRIFFKYDEKIIQILIIGNRHSLINKKVLFCKENEIVMVKLVMKLKEEVSIPYTIPCKFTIHKNEILSLNAKHYENKIKIQWSLRRPSYANIIHYHGGKLEIIPRISSKNDSHDILNVTDQKSHICLVTLDLFQESINRFKCATVEPRESSIGPVTNIQTVVLNEMIFLKWDPPVNQSDHPKGYIVTYNNSKDPCNSLVINKVNQEDSSTIVCGNVMRFFVSPSQIYVPITSLTSDTTYRIDIIPVQNPRSPIKTSFSLRTTNDDCFLPCSESTSNMTILRNRVHICNSFKSLGNRSHKVKQPLFCSLIEFRQSMCPSRGLKVCNLPKCSALQKVSGCVTDTDYNVYGSSVTVAWMPPESGDEVKGYIILLYANSRCEQFNIQLCQNCSMTIRGPMLNYYKDCQQKTEGSSLLYETIFDNLKEKQRYRIYIVPLMEDGYLGAIRQLSFYTSKINNNLTDNIGKVTKKPTEEIDIIEEEENVDSNKLEEIDTGHIPRVKKFNSSKTSEKDIDEINTDYNSLTERDLEEVNTKFETEKYPVKEIKPPDNSKDQNHSIRETEPLENSKDQDYFIREINPAEDFNDLQHNIPFPNNNDYDGENIDENDFKNNKRIKNKRFRWLDTLETFAKLFKEIKSNYDHSKNKNLSKPLGHKFKLQKEKKSLLKQFNPQQKHFNPFKNNNTQRWNNNQKTNILKTNNTRRTNSFRWNNKPNTSIFKTNHTRRTNSFRWNNKPNTSIFKTNHTRRTNSFRWNNFHKQNIFKKHNDHRERNFRSNNNQRMKSFGRSNNNNNRINNFGLNKNQKMNNFPLNNNRRTNNFPLNNNRRTNNFPLNNNRRTNNFPLNNNRRTNNFRWNNNQRTNNFRWNNSQRTNNFGIFNRPRSSGSRGGGRKSRG